MIYPYLQYCNIVWANTYQSNLRRLVILQKRIIRIINKSGTDDHTTPIFKNLKLLKFHDINKLCVSLCFASKITYYLQVLRDYVPQILRCIVTTLARSHHLFHVPSKRTKVSQFALSYQGPLLFNSISKKLKNCSSYSSFTNKLKDYLFSFYT